MSSVAQSDVFMEFEKYTRFQRIIGMSTLTYSRGKIRVSMRWLVINLLNTGSILLVNFFTVSSIRKSVLYINKWYYYFNTGNYIVVTCSILVAWFRSSRNVKLLNRALFKMRNVDLRLISIGGKLPPENPRWSQILIYLLVSAAFLLRFILTRTFIGCVVLIIVYIPFFLIISIQDNIDRIGSIIGLRFVALNQLLVRCFGMETKAAVPVLENIVLCHHHLYNCSAEIDKYYSFQIITLLGTIFVSSFCEMFAAISIIFKNEAVTNKELTITLKTFWLIVIATMMSRICHLFQSITIQAKEFNTLLYQIMIEDKTNEILTNPKLKLHIAMNREVVFTANGFFKLDYSLVHSIIASSATYLVILLQFSQESTANPKSVRLASIGNTTTTELPFFLTTV